MTKSYYEKLKDPRWQKKRLKILERDDWQCQNCGSDYKTLHVHHKKYSGEPWDVDDKYLETLCEDCHNNEHDNSKRKLRDSETNQLIVVGTAKFIKEYHDYLNKDYHKGPYTILGNLENKIRYEDDPPNHILITSNNTEFHFKLSDIYYDEISIVVNYEFIETIK